MWYKNISGRFFGLVTKHACDRRTGGRTDRQNYYSQDRASIAARAVKTVRHMLSDRCPVCPVCPVCLSVTLVCCGQTVGWTKMSLGTEVGLGPGDIVLDGDPAPPMVGAQHPPPRHFSAHVFCGQTVVHLSNC